MYGLGISLSIRRGGFLEPFESLLQATFFQAEGQAVPKFGHSVGQGPDSKVFLVCVLVNTCNLELTLSGSVKKFLLNLD